MNPIKILLAVGILLSHAQELCGQYQNIWFRGTLSKSLGSKVKADAELQHRRQSGYDNRYVMDQDLMYTFRTWAYYQLNYDVRFSVSPFAYFSHYKIIQKPEDELTKSSKEIRYSAAVDLQHELFHRFFVTDKMAVEYRTVSGNQKDIVRMRAKIGVRYELSEKIRIAIFEEHFINSRGVSTDHHFDHERHNISLDYKVMPVLRLELGYVHIKRLPLSGVSMLNENNVFLNMIYGLPQSHKRNDASLKNSATLTDNIRKDFGR